MGPTGAAGAAEEASNSRPFIVAARAGFAVSGVLHILIGVIAVQLAFGKNQEADQGGAMAQLATQPAGFILLWFGAAACAALALWQLSEVVFGYRHAAMKTKAMKKLSAAGQGIVFLALAFAFASFAVGNGRDSGKSTSNTTTEIFKVPFGPGLLVTIGIVIGIVGVVFVVRGARASFKQKLNLPASAALRKITMTLGIVGYVAKGIALFLVGLLFIIATLESRPRESTGLDGALKAVREQPFGPYLLTLIGVGLACYGLYLMAKARFARM